MLQGVFRVPSWLTRTAGTIFLLTAQSSLCATLTVTNTEDKGPGSLRQAILDANAIVEADLIAFNIPGQAPFTISPATPLLGITRSASIDGTTQPGFAGKPIIELDGSGVTAQQAAGLRLAAANCTVRGLVINGFQSRESAGLLIVSSGNVIQANYIGTEVTGEIALPNYSAVWIENSSNNLLGGTQSVEPTKPPEI